MLVTANQYIIGERPAEFAELFHLRFVQHEGCFRFSWRLSGAPGWSSALTPMHGTATVSPFLALAER